MLCNKKQYGRRCSQGCSFIVFNWILKAIKYGVWTSTFKNTEKLNEAFVDGLKEGTDVFLFFSVVKSGQFEGVARMSSEL